MRQTRDQTAKLFFSLVLCFLIPIAYAESPMADHSEDVYPAINVRNSQTQISRNGLSAIFKMRHRKWNDGTSITVFVMKDENPIHKKFSKLILNVFPHQLRRTWNKAVFSGSGQAPREVDSKEEMVEKISNTPGAIGYLSPTDINEKIKILTVR